MDSKDAFPENTQDAGVGVYVDSVGTVDGVAVGGCGVNVNVGGLGVNVAVGDLDVGVHVGRGVRVFVGRGVRVWVESGVAVSVSDDVEDSDSVGVGVSVSVGVEVAVSVAVDVSVAPAVVGPGLSGTCASITSMTCGDGLAVDFGRLKPAFCEDAPAIPSVFNFTK